VSADLQTVIISCFFFGSLSNKCVLRIGSQPASFSRGIGVLLLCLAIQPVFSAELTHRYSFDTDASDPLGNADGVFQGAAFITNGAVVLNGSNSFVQLPNDP
jgi:hypothetical protein